MFRPFFSLVLAVFVCLGAAAAVAASPARGAGDVDSVDAGEFFTRINAEKGKVVVVNVFASWCPPCRDEIPGLVNVRRAFPPDRVALLGVSVDREPKALVKYMEEMKMNYPVLLARGDFIQRVRVRAVPQLLIYNQRGELVFNHQGLMDEADIRSSIDVILSR
jgi:thiol-disulfide isomerase/thioredoxin